MKEALPISNIPNNVSIKKTAKLPSRYGKIVNLAGIEDVCNLFASWARKNIVRFKEQEARDNFTKDGGILDINDRMWRVALNRDTSNDQTKDTLSNVTSPVFRVAIRAISSAEVAIMFQDDRLPAEFEPEINTTEYTSDDGSMIAKHQNALEQFVFDEDNRKTKIKELVEYVNRDQMRVAMIEWIRETRDVTENVPIVEMGTDENGLWRQVKPKTRLRVVRDWPVLTIHKINDWFFDANIPDFQNQRCVAFRTRIGIEKLYAMQRDGFIQNVDEISTSHLYRGNTEEDEVVEHQQRNAGESEETDATGEINVWRVWGRVPISFETTPKTGKAKAKWDESKNIPELYEAMFAGDLTNGNVVCLKLVKLPHWHGEIPAKIIYSHRDDKGAFHTGYGQQMESLYWQAVTNLNQAVDNVTERNWSPLVIHGQSYTRDLTFRKNKVIKLSQNAKLERLNIPDTTQITMEMYRIIQEMIDDLIGVNKSMKGEYAGARTTATENVNVVGFASQPLDEQAAYMMDQIYPWMYRLDAMYFRQYADPNVVLSITHENAAYDVNPQTLYGPIKTKITAMNRFKRSTLEKQGLSQLLQNVIPLLGDVIPPEGKRVLGKEALRIFKFPKINEIFPEKGNVEAEVAASRTVQDILMLGEWVEPQEGEDHKAQLPILKAALRAFASLPEGQRPQKEQLDMMRTHIELREQMVAANGSGAQNQLKNPAAAPQEGMQGQSTGDLMAGLMQNQPQR